MKDTKRKKVYSGRSVTAMLLAALVASTTIIPAFSDNGEIHLINDLGGFGGDSYEAQAERDWNEDIVAVAKSAWLDAHAGEDRESLGNSEATASDLAEKAYMAASGSDLAQSGSARPEYDVFADVDDAAAAGAISA